jgi:hypothetical protein
MQPAKAQTARPDSVPRLVRTIKFKDYGSTQIRFGDLNGDGVPDALLVQATEPDAKRQTVITCLTAIDLKGRVLWQVGKPSIRNQHRSSDLPVQIYDLDHDGQPEVIYIPDEKNVLTILDGRTGKVKKQVQLAGGHDSILFADFSGRGYAQEVVVKDRYTSFWVYDAAQNFKLLWSKVNVNTGYYPSAYDFNGDGKEGLLCGFTLYSSDGKELWNRADLPGRNNAAYIDDVNGDGRGEIAIATSQTAILLDAGGQTIFQKQMEGAQHIVIGKFRPDVPGKQVFVIGRDRRIGFAREAFYSKEGELLWDNSGQSDIDKDGWITVGMVVDNWTGKPNENFVCLYRNDAPPKLIDGRGRVIASFPLPSAIAETESGAKRTAVPRPDRPDYAHDSELAYAKHLDCYGDEREEILIFNHRGLSIYTNAAAWYKPYLYNDTGFPGRK